MCAVLGVSVATGIGVTTNVMVADFPSLVAVMMTDSDVPPRTGPAVTSPVLLTDATSSLVEDHKTGRPERDVPLDPEIVAVS